MTPEERKERYRLFWMVKGHLNADENTIFDSYDGYFRRLWGNHENYYREDGFEEAYSEIFPNLSLTND